jgi:hypothetical protein
MLNFRRKARQHWTHYSVSSVNQRANLMLERFIVVRKAMQTDNQGALSGFKDGMLMLIDFD